MEKYCSFNSRKTRLYVFTIVQTNIQVIFLPINKCFYFKRNHIVNIGINERFLYQYSYRRLGLNLQGFFFIIRNF